MSGGEPLLERLSRAADAATGDDDRAATFARGLILGALVGAAIAGSTIWQRRQARLAGKLEAKPKGGGSSEASMDAEMPRG